MLLASKKRIWAGLEGGNYKAFLVSPHGHGEKSDGRHYGTFFFFASGEKIMIPHLRGT